MNGWKNNFNEKVLKQGLKYKNNTSIVDYDGYSLKANIKSNNTFNVELVLQNGILFDMECSCSKKSSCAHEAGVLYFLDEFPEVLEDFPKSSDVTDISQIDVSDDLKIISDSKLKKFLKKEFKNNLKFKYDFIKYFKEESLIDIKSYEKKIKKILRHGKGQGFSNHGYYELHRIGSDLKKFINNDIDLLIEQRDYKNAYVFLNQIMDTFIDQIYWDEDAWYDIAYYYREYCFILLESNEITSDEKQHIMGNLHIIGNIVF